TPVAAVPRGSTWRYREGVSEPPASWNAPGFDDSGWSSAPAAFGYGYATATRNHGAGSFESFDASALRGLLVAGTNVFAVEGHNVDATGHDFFLDPEL